MEVEKKSEGLFTILLLKGRFDAHEIEPVTTWVKDQLDIGNTHLIINLEGVNFIDSTALSTLVQGLKRAREKGGDLRLCCFQQPVRVIFELTRLDKAFGIYPTEEAARASYATE